jgi:hypothetical protein
MQRKPLTTTAATLLAATTLALALLGAACAVHATSPDLSRLDSAQLEDLFWDCDVHATHEAMSPGDGALCATIGDALKERRFDGDFLRMLDWWRDAKAAEHAARAEPEQTEPDDLVLQTP